MNKVVHFEIPAKDMARAKKFYEDTFGWQINAWDQKYFMAITGPTEEKKGPSEPGFINGGIAEVSDHFTAPVLVMGVENIDEALAKVTAAGGEMIGETVPVSDMGLYARVRDSEGNVIGLWQELKRAM